MEGEKIQELGQDSIEVTKNTKGYNYSVKVYKTKDETIEDLQTRLNTVMSNLEAKYGTNNAPF